MSFVVSCSRVADVRPALRYDMRLGCHSKLGLSTLVSSNISVNDLNRAVAEMRAAAAMRPEISKPFLRISISAAHDRLSRRDWSALMRNVLARFGIDPTQHPYEVHEHPETDHDHVHCTTSRISIAGHVVEGAWELLRLIEAVREAAVEMKLIDRSDQIRGEDYRLIRANRIRKRLGLASLTSDEIVATLSACQEAAYDRSSFIQAARQAGFELILVRWKDGREKGLVLVVPGTQIKLALSAATNGEMSILTIDSVQQRRRDLADAVERATVEPDNSSEPEATVDPLSFGGRSDSNCLVPPAAECDPEVAIVSPTLAQSTEDSLASEVETSLPGLRTNADLIHLGGGSSDRESDTMTSDQADQLFDRLLQDRSGEAVFDPILSAGLKRPSVIAEERRLQKTRRMGLQSEPATDAAKEAREYDPAVEKMRLRRHRQQSDEHKRALLKQVPAEAELKSAALQSLTDFESRPPEIVDENAGQECLSARDLPYEALGAEGTVDLQPNLEGAGDESVDDRELERLRERPSG